MVIYLHETSNAALFRDDAVYNMILGTCVGGCFIGGGFKILDFAQNNLAYGTVVTQTQLAITCVLKPPPLKPPTMQVPNCYYIILLLLLLL